MNRLISALIAFLISIISAGCNGSEIRLVTDDNSKPSTSKTVMTEETNLTKTDILVAYFSCTGTTEKLADYAADYLNADLYEIEAAVPYTESDLAYYTDCRADREQNDKNARPEIKGKVEDMSGYKTVVLAYPIWHGQAPRIISTFLESYDFSEKTIIPFCTSHSSGIGNSDAALHSLCSDSTVWKSGKRFGSEASKNDIQEFLDASGAVPFEGKEDAAKTVGEFDFETKSVLLNSGYTMP